MIVSACAAILVVAAAALALRSRTGLDVQQAIMQWCRAACAPLWLLGTVFAVWSSWGTTSPGRLVSLLAVPAAVCLAGSLLPGRWFHGTTGWTLVAILLLFVALSGFSIGLYYLPALLALLTAAVLHPPPGVSQPAGRRRPAAGHSKGG